MAIRSLAMVTVGSKTFLRLAVRPNIGWDERLSVHRANAAVDVEGFGYQRLINAQ
jgi:hypothetical protein